MPYSFSPFTPLVQANLNTDQSISSATYTKVAFDTETIDTGSIYNTGTYTATIATAGKYLIIASVNPINVTGASEFSAVQIANSDRSTVYSSIIQSGFTGYGYHAMTTAVVVDLAVNNTISAYIYITEAGNLNEDNTFI